MFRRGKRGIQQIDKRAAALFAQADTHRDAGRWKQAAEGYRAGLEIEPGRFAYWVQLGNMSKDFGDFDAADEAYLKAMALDQNDVDLHIQRGHLASRMGDKAEARRRYGHAATLDDKNDNSLLALAAVAQAEGEWSKAAETLTTYLAEHPYAGFAWIQIGHVHRSAGSLRDAEDAYRMGLERNGDKGDGLVSLASLHTIQGRNGEARAALHEAFKAGSRHPEVMRAMLWKLSDSRLLKALAEAVPSLTTDGDGFVPDKPVSSFAQLMLQVARSGDRSA